MNISLAFGGGRIVLFIFFSILFFSFIVSYAQYLARIIERDNSAVGRNRFTGHPRCGKFDNWVSNNSVLLLARKDFDSLSSYLKQENVKWLVILCYVNIPAYERVQENLLFWTKWLLNIEMFSPFFRRFLFFVLSSKILEALYAQG